MAAMAAAETQTRPGSALLDLEERMGELEYWVSKLWRRLKTLERDWGESLAAEAVQTELRSEVRSLRSEIKSLKEMKGRGLLKKKKKMKAMKAMKAMKKRPRS